MAATMRTTKVNANTTWMLLRQWRQYRPPNPRRTCGVFFAGSTPNCAASSRCYRTGAWVGSLRSSHRPRHLSVGGASSTFGGSAPGDGVSCGDPKQGREQFVVTGSLLDARRAGSDSPLPGQFLSISHAFGPEAVAAFAAHAGDDNPIHLDENYARQTGPRTYDGCIVHGLMVAGLFSTAFGRAISGALYVSQTLRFERPVLVGERVDARVEVERARVTSSGREVLVRCSTVASLADGTVAVSGQAKVLLPRTCEVRSW
ncbi:unnamed protein product [Ectocarpus sp. 6 AP-2014]